MKKLFQNLWHFPFTCFLFRRDLLREAVSDWLAQAESIKSRLETETEHLGNQEEIQNMRVGGGSAVPVAKFEIG
jgi:hypothetical protein